MENSPSKAAKPQTEPQTAMKPPIQPELLPVESPTLEKLDGLTDDQFTTLAWAANVGELQILVFGRCWKTGSWFCSIIRKPRPAQIHGVKPRAEAPGVGNLYPPAKAAGLAADRLSHTNRFFQMSHDIA